MEICKLLDEFITATKYTIDLKIDLIYDQFDVLEMNHKCLIGGLI